MLSLTSPNTLFRKAAKFQDCQAFRDSFHFNPPGHSRERIPELEVYRWLKDTARRSAD